MNIQELIELGKPVLAKINEDAGSEGLKYKAYFSGPVSVTENEEFRIMNTGKQDSYTIAEVEFAYPHDCGLAMTTLKRLYENVEKLELIY